MIYVYTRTWSDIDISIYPSTCLSIYQYLSAYLSIYRSIFLCVHVSTFRSIHIYACIHISYAYIYIPTQSCASSQPSIHPSTNPSPHPSIHPSIQPSLALPRPRSRSRSRSLSLSLYLSPLSLCAEHTRTRTLCASPHALARVPADVPGALLNTYFPMRNHSIHWSHCAISFTGTCCVSWCRGKG